METHPEVAVFNPYDGDFQTEVCRDVKILIAYHTERLVRVVQSTMLNPYKRIYMCIQYIVLYSIHTDIYMRVLYADNLQIYSILYTCSITIS